MSSIYPFLLLLLHLSLLPKLRSSVFTNNHAYHDYQDPTEWGFDNTTLAQLVREMASEAIKYQFINLQLVSTEGKLPNDLQITLAPFLEISREVAPSQKLVVVINGNYDIVFASEAIKKTLVKQISELVAHYDFDGVQLDIEPFYSADDDQYLDFVKQVKQVIRGKELSVASPIAENKFSNGYIGQLAQYVDMFCVMIYDLQSDNVLTPEHFSDVWKRTVLRYSDAIAQSQNPQSMLAPIMPAYEKKFDKRGGMYHDPSIENIKSAEVGLKLALAAGATVYGSGVFWWPRSQGDIDQYGHDYAMDRKYWTHWISNYGNLFKNNLIYHQVNRYYQSDKDIVSAVQQMRDLTTRIQLIDLGWLDVSGHLDNSIQVRLANYISISKATDSNQRILAVINVHSENLLSNPASESVFLMELTYFLQSFPVEGIQLNMNPYLEDDSRYLLLLSKLQLILKQFDRLFAVTAPCFSVRWSNKFISKVAGLVDMINVLMFDMEGVPDWGTDVVYSAAEYRAVWKRNIIRYSNAIFASENKGCLLAPIMPCYPQQNDEEGVVYHDPEIENIWNAGNGLIQAIEAGAIVYGSGVFKWEDLIDNAFDKNRKIWREWVH